MRTLAILVIIAAAAYFWYHRSENANGAYSGEIANPVYAEFRISMKVPGREIEMAAFGKMVNAEDCEKRSDDVWNKTIKNCEQCQINTITCRADLEPRYRKLFDNAPIHSTYMTFDHGSKTERDGRMVIYGLTSDEGDKVCEILSKKFQQDYTGKVGCVAGIRD
jgi:hypothetical protein